MVSKFTAQYEKYRRDKEVKENKKFRHAMKKAAKNVVLGHRRKSIDPPFYQPGMKKDFYLTREWRNLRWEVLRESDMHCKACGRGREHGIILHVDHIKPRSKFPSLELVKENLQVLCEDCNLGKGAKI